MGLFVIVRVDTESGAVTAAEPGPRDYEIDRDVTQEEGTQALGVLMAHLAGREDFQPAQFQEDITGLLIRSSQAAPASPSGTLGGQDQTPTEEDRDEVVSQ